MDCAGGCLRFGKHALQALGIGYRIQANPIPYLCAGTTLGPATLFFGCRARDQDYIYASELAGFMRCGALAGLHVAFSREGADKDYVQHHIAREAAALAELMMVRACLLRSAVLAWPVAGYGAVGLLAWWSSAAVVYHGEAG